MTTKMNETREQLSESFEKLNQCRQADDLELIEAYAIDVAHAAHLLQTESKATEEGVAP